MNFCGVLLIIFVVLKLTGLITWSWIWVLSPFWVPFGLFVCLIILALLSGYER